MGTAEIIVLIMLTVWSVLMIIAGFDYDNREYGDNPLKRKKRKMKRKNVETICYYRRVMAFNRKHLPDSEWVNNDIRSISKGVFIKCTKN